MEYVSNKKLVDHVKLNDLNVQYLAANHCTGLDAICYFKHRFTQTFHPSPVGTHTRATITKQMFQNK